MISSSMANANTSGAMNDAMKLLDIAGDPKKYRDRLEGITNAEAGAKSAFAALGIGKDAVKARTAMEEKLEKAEKTLNDAKLTASNIIDKANADAEKIRVEMHDEGVSLGKARAKTALAVKKLEDRAQEVDEGTKTLATQMARYETANGVLKADRAELKANTEMLQTAINRIGKM